MAQLKILHVIGSLETGGVERVLCRLLSQFDSALASYHVVTLTSGGSLLREYESSNIPVRSLHMQRGVPNPAGLIRLIRLLKVEKPDVVVGWMYHSCVLSTIASAMAGTRPVVWNIRDSGAGHSCFKRSTRIVSLAAKWLSNRSRPTIAYVSQSGRTAHEAAGYSSANSTVLPNGFDTCVFCPDDEARRVLREELRLGSSARLIGLFGRVHPDKDHQSFFRAAARVHAADPNAHFVLCGAGTSRENEKVAMWIKQAGVEHATHLLGLRTDMPKLCAGIDLLVSSSSSEAFPNAVGETMSCGVPCVVTDVGDSAYLVGGAGRVVPSRDATQLASAILELLKMPPHELQKLGAIGRARIISTFSLDVVARMHERLWLTAATRRSRGELMANRKAA